MLFKSQHESITIPTRATTYDFLFSPSTSKLFPAPSGGSSSPGYTSTVTGESITHAQTRTQSTHLSTALTKIHDLQPGDVVSICSPNSIHYPVALFGIMRAGGLPALSSPTYTISEMTHAFTTVNTKYIFTSPSALPIIKATASTLSIPNERIFILDGDEKGFVSLRELVEKGKEIGGWVNVLSWRIPEGKSNSEVCAVLCFSSGTTGLPKAVMISHQNIVVQCLQLLPTTSDDHKTVLGLLPFYHVTGVIKMLTLPIVIHAEVVIPPPFTLPSLLDVIVKYQIAEVQMVPPIIIRMVRDPIVSKYDLSCIKRFASGAAPISQEVLRELEKKFPGRGFKQGYGMTESVGCITTHPLGKHGFEYARTGGTLVANTEVTVINREGKEVGVDEKGEILARGPQIFMGYFNNGKATAEAFDAEGWFKTGDEGSINSEGFIEIHDRIKEMIKVKGVQVAPAELEDLLLGHEIVEDCAAVGVVDEYSGERPLAFVVLKPGVGRRGGVEDKLMEYVKEKKSRPKWLKEVRIVDEIPKSASGKILRRVLRDRLKAEARQPKAKL